MACNVTDAAADLDVPPSDLRRLMWANPKLQERRLRSSSRGSTRLRRTLAEALHSDDPRMRVAASFFVVKTAIRANRRVGLLKREFG